MLYPITLSAFRVGFPEFNMASDELVLSKLAGALLEINPVVWGKYAGEGQAYLTAHLLAISPFGETSRLESNKEKTIYYDRYEKLKYTVTALMFRVI